MPAQTFLFGAFPEVPVFKSSHKSSSSFVILPAQLRMCESLNTFSLWKALLNQPCPQAIKEDELFGVKLSSCPKSFPGFPGRAEAHLKFAQGGCTAIKNLVLPSQWLRWSLALVLPGSLKSNFCEPFLPILLAFYPKTLCQTRKKKEEKRKLTTKL